MTEPLEVVGYETLANVYIGVYDSGSDWSARQSLRDGAESMLELCAEIRRLQGGIQAVRDECAKVEAKYNDTPRDPSLRWYEFDRVQEDLSVRDDVQQDIIKALDTALKTKEED